MERLPWKIPPGLMKLNDEKDLVPLEANNDSHPRFGKRISFFFFKFIS